MVLAMDHAHHPECTRTYFQKIETVKKQIAFFDFDGTLTTKDTLLEFIRFSRGDLRFFLGFLINSPWLIAYKLKLIPNQTAKERILSWFFRNRTLASFHADCDRFAATVIPRLLRSKGLQEIALLQQKEIAVVIVSASPGDWISPWSRSVGASLIATKLQLHPISSQQTAPGQQTVSGQQNVSGQQTVSGQRPAPGQQTAPGRKTTPDADQNREPRLTGRIDGKNCHGPEKVRRIREQYPADEYDIAYAYGDTGGDRPMLALARHPFMKPFR
jgi:phosphatidylglycerophosphatase C